MSGATLIPIMERGKAYALTAGTVCLSDPNSEIYDYFVPIPDAVYDRAYQTHGQTSLVFLHRVFERDFVRFAACWSQIACNYPDPQPVDGKLQAGEDGSYGFETHIYESKLALPPVR